MYDILAFNAKKTQEKRKKNTNIYPKKYISSHSTHRNAIKIML